ncbi:FecR domain-containing protein [Massilia sp. TS11]|uniref:FecR family protein n=1 Tax=Massilia sp. TS11 TaxID=2908003 RepID=UPI001EDC0747|nr:FecR family protein [Massilia sp. TS11]MCG2583035.1 FecR family protein [Massilia sp. TS11]
MNLRKRTTATKALIFLAAALLTQLALAAQVAGTITRLSGPLLAKKADGTAKILTVKSEVEEGDTLVTEKNTYAQVKFVDNSEITLKPATTFKVENFAYDAGKPDADSAAFNLIKGGLRSVTGALGKRNKEKFAMKTPAATIGIRGTTFTADFIPGEATATAALQNWLRASVAMNGDQLPAGVVPLQLAQANPPPSGGLPPGLHVGVFDGAISLTNRGGTQNFNAGQFGYTPSINQPPVIVPSNPGLQFNPPPSFNSSPGQNSSNKSGGKQGVDCEVR